MSLPVTGLAGLAGLNEYIGPRLIILLKANGEEIPFYYSLRDGTFS